MFGKKHTEKEVLKFNLANGFFPLEKHDKPVDRGLITSVGSELSNTKILKLLSDNEQGNLPASVEAPIDPGTAIDVSDPDFGRRIAELPLYGIRYNPAELTQRIQAEVRRTFRNLLTTQTSKEEKTSKDTTSSSENSDSGTTETPRQSTSTD